MTASLQDQQDHFAHCIQVFGGIAASSRRLGIDERALRRFINGELRDDRLHNEQSDEGFGLGSNNQVPAKA